MPHLCVDFGSTFTKALLVADDGTLLGTASHRTTVDTDVMEGYDAVRAELGAESATTLACSSAGGGLRILVIGQEALVTAEAGRRVALSSGGVVTGVLSSADLDDLAGQLSAARPDVVLLTGGTDGGNGAPLLRAAEALAEVGWRGPVVVAGNVDARDEAAAALAGASVALADNVLPRIGVLAPDSARAAIRELFLSHVIGGKQLSARAEFAELVRGATPDVVLTGLELLAEAADLPTGVAVVDIGGATTDIHSVVRLDAEVAELGRDVVAQTPVTRTVEGDLGMRWSAVSTAAAAAHPSAGLAVAAQRRRADPGFLPADAAESAYDEELARAATATAVRRHVGRSQVVLSPEGRVVERTGKDLREIDVLIGSGGVLRASDDERAARILGAATGPTPEGWQQPEAPRLLVDRDHLLVAIGLLAPVSREAAGRLAASLIGRHSDG